MAGSLAVSHMQKSGSLASRAVTSAFISPWPQPTQISSTRSNLVVGRETNSRWTSACSRLKSMSSMRLAILVTPSCSLSHRRKGRVAWVEFIQVPYAPR